MFGFGVGKTVSFWGSSTDDRYSGSKPLCLFVLCNNYQV